MSDAVAHKAKYFVGVLLICGTLFGGYQAWRKGESEREERAIAAEQSAELRETHAALAEARANAAQLAIAEKEAVFLRALNADTFARISVNEQGEIDGFSAGASKLTNIPAEEAIGRSFAALHLFDDGKAAELEAAPTGKTLKITLPMARPGKKPVEVEARSEGIETEAGRASIISLNRANSVLELPTAAE